MKRFVLPATAAVMQFAAGPSPAMLPAPAGSNQE
jgi:hypothetical protein